MSEIHQFKCDFCNRKVSATYNGEHFLPPKGWLDLKDFNLCQDVGHVCPDCLPKKLKRDNK